MARDVELDNTMAHELFHCVQGEWEGTFPSAGEDFVEEAGASDFADKLLGQCAPGDASRGPALDQHTANRSLLETSYDAWFFWAYLDEHGKLGAAQIGQLHRAFEAGTPIDEALRSFVPDIDRTMNEFYVRMMGPGLACGFQGWHTTGQRDITDVGPVEFADAPWQGTRYTSTGTASLFGVSSTSTSTDSAGAPYTCEDDVMTIALQGQQIGLTRIGPVRGNPYFG